MSKTWKVVFKVPGSSNIFEVAPLTKRKAKKMAEDLHKTGEAKWAIYKEI